MSNSLITVPSSVLMNLILPQLNTFLLDINQLDPLAAMATPTINIDDQSDGETKTDGGKTKKKKKKEKREKKKRDKRKLGYEEADGITTPSKEQLPQSQASTPAAYKLPVS